MYPVPQQTPPSPTYDAMPPVTPPAMPPAGLNAQIQAQIKAQMTTNNADLENGPIPQVQPPMKAPVQAPIVPNNADLENGPDGEDLNNNIKEIRG